jgi:hypothetical protein
LFELPPAQLLHTTDTARKPLVMRSALESMLQAPPQSLPIADFCEELTKNMSLPQAKVTSFQTHVQATAIRNRGE